MSPSTGFALNQLSAHLKKTKRIGAVVAVNSATCAAGKTSTQRCRPVFVFAPFCFYFFIFNAVQSGFFYFMFAVFSAFVGVRKMSELLSHCLPGTQLSQTKQEEESLGRLTFLRSHKDVWLSLAC